MFLAVMAVWVMAWTVLVTVSLASTQVTDTRSVSIGVGETLTVVGSETRFAP